MKAANVWKALDNAMPADWFRRRIESTADGTPDVYVSTKTHGSFWIELKTTDTIRPSQRVWWLQATQAGTRVFVIRKNKYGWQLYTVIGELAVPQDAFRGKPHTAKDIVDTLPYFL